MNYLDGELESWSLWRCEKTNDWLVGGAERTWVMGRIRGSADPTEITTCLKFWVAGVRLGIEAGRAEQQKSGGER